MDCLATNGFFSFRCAGVNSRAIRGCIYSKLAFITVIIAIHEFEVRILASTDDCTTDVLAEFNNYIFFNYTCHLQKTCRMQVEFFVQLENLPTV